MGARLCILLSFFFILSPLFPLCSLLVFVNMLNIFGAVRLATKTMERPLPPTAPVR